MTKSELMDAILEVVPDAQVTITDMISEEKAGVQIGIKNYFAIWKGKSPKVIILVNA